MTKISFLAAGFAFASTTLALPRVVSLADAGREPISLKNVADDNAPCNKQSCEIANLAGSTGKLPTIKPEGGDANGYRCISRWSPETVAAANKAPRGPAQNTGISGALTGAIASLGGALTFNPTVTGTFKGSCTKNIVIFARGTTETGLLGITVGPVLNNGLRGPNWSVVGVAYDADFAGDNCLGLPGGQVAKDMLNQAAKKCPTSKIFMSGYSEGAMVAHNGVAYAEEESKKHVAAIVTFGDPFMGAKVKGYTGPILTYCNAGDSVCTGNFVVSASHLTYTGNVAQQAMAAMRKLAA